MTKRIRKVVQTAGAQHKPADSISSTSPDDVPYPMAPVSEATVDDVDTTVQPAEERACNTVAQYASLDVLRVIFEYAHHATCHGKARSALALNLSHVTSGWRRAALSTSALWSTVMLDEGQPGCRALVQMSLERVSPTELLDVVITQRPSLMNIDGPPALGAICQGAHQWRSIMLSSKHALNKLDSIVRVVGEEKLGNLETIRLINSAEPDAVATAVRSPPAVHLGTDPFTTLFLCRNLTSLDLGEGFVLDFEVPQLLTILNIDSPSLSRLALGTRRPCYLRALGAPLAWNSLKSLQFSLLSPEPSGPWICRSAPALTRLELGSLNARGWSSFLSIIHRYSHVYPCVTELRLFDARFEVSTRQVKPYRRASIFGALLTPGSSTRATNAMLSQTPPIFMPVVLPVDLKNDHDSLSQRNLPADVEDLPELHETMPALVTLELEDVPSTRLLLWLRSMSGGVGAGAVCHWPELRNITLRGSAVRHLKPVVLVALAEARRAAGRPLDRIRLEGGWPQGPPAKVLQRLSKIVTLETTK
jgi:hypothetical protein